MDEKFEIRFSVPTVLVAERERVFRLLNNILPHADISEVGSTAVEGAIGKQDVDIAVLVAEGDFESARIALDKIFPRDEKQLSSGNYQGFRASPHGDVGVQLTVKDGPYNVFRDFVDALRSRPALLHEYNCLKRAWDGKPMNRYREAKSQFIEQVLNQVSKRR